jgi:hypothetical protein
MKLFFVVLARGFSGVQEKISELRRLGYPYVVVCGDDVDVPNVVFRRPRGKFDAINYGLTFVPPDAEVVALNDVDTGIHNLDSALSLMEREDADLVFARVDVGSGPQLRFYSFLDGLRNMVPIAASGELMLIRRCALDGILPLQGCKAEDSYVLFKVLEKGGRALLSAECFVTTRRTALGSEEEDYKRRTVGGIYQALSLSKPPVLVRLFYMLLPLISPLLMASGKNGYYWAKGILLGYLDHLRGDRAVSWKPTYAQDA